MRTYSKAIVIHFGENIFSDLTLRVRNCDIHHILYLSNTGGILSSVDNITTFVNMSVHDIILDIVGRM
jgi:hypothetical protein